MSGLIIAAVAGLLTPQAAPHPSSFQPYAAPAIRPFEPGPDFGVQTAEGDAAAPAGRRPVLTAPVTVDAYAGAYEAAPTDVEAAYAQGVAAAEIRTDQTAGPLDGTWLVRDAAGADMLELVLMASGDAAEGGWRRGGGYGPAVARDGVLTLDGYGSITLERAGDGWRGRLSRDGQTRPVTLSRPN